MRTKLLILCFTICSSALFAQKKLADKFFDNYGYIKASELYLEAVKKGDSSEHVLTRLGDSYYNNSDSEQAALWYGKAINKYNKVNPEVIYKYIQSLRSLGKYDEAIVWLNKFKEIQSGDSRIKYDQDDIDIYSKLSKTNSDLIVNVEKLPFNSGNSDFGAYIHEGKLYFASARGGEGNKTYTWTNEPFLDIYEVSVEKESDGKLKFGSPSMINSSKINSDYHEASVAITNDGKTIYFTRDNVNRRNRLEYDKKGTTHLKLYKATMDGESWENIEELPFNDEVFSTGHPTLSPDNTKLYFVSDREGGLGQTDIYVVDINEDGSYGEPQNLGESINTAGREMFPFIAKDSTLYFSSDGYLNLGLLDIFKSNYLKGDTAEPENLGAPYNSGYDDFAFFIDSEDEHSYGYFSSNRSSEGSNDDDIYGFNAYKCKQTIEGVATDSKTYAVLSGVEVRLIDETGKVLSTVTTGEDGTYRFEDVDCNTTVTVVGTKPDYKDDQKVVITDDENDKVNKADLSLEPLINDNQIVINPIFFDFDKWNIRTDAQYELENIVDVMRNHPNMVIKIESHTDSRGGDRYNMKLSDRRAKSTRDYIISRGIDPNRIESAIGYGESQLLNKCSNGVRCTKAEHQLNRRSYFYIVKE